MIAAAIRKRKLQHIVLSRRKTAEHAVEEEVIVKAKERGRQVAIIITLAVPAEVQVRIKRFAAETFERILRHGEDKLILAYRFMLDQFSCRRSLFIFRQRTDLSKLLEVKTAVGDRTVNCFKNSTAVGSTPASTPAAEIIGRATVSEHFPTQETS